MASTFGAASVFTCLFCGIVSLSATCLYNNVKLEHLLIMSWAVRYISSTEIMGPPWGLLASALCYTKKLQTQLSRNLGCNITISMRGVWHTRSDGPVSGDRIRAEQFGRPESAVGLVSQHQTSRWLGLAWLKSCWPQHNEALLVFRDLIVSDGSMRSCSRRCFLAFLHS